MHVTPADVALVRRALDLLSAEEQQDPSAADIPVASLVVTRAGEVIGTGTNRRTPDADPTAHAEIVALRQAAALLGTWRLAGCTLVVTMEPCPMCAGAAQAARLDRVVFGAWNPDYGAAGSVFDLLRDRRLHHRVEVVGGVLEQECSAAVRDFFADRRR